MLALAFRFIQRTLVKRQFRRRTERIKRLLGDRHQFRIEPGGFPGDLRTFGRNTVLTGIVGAVRRIFIVLQMSIDRQLFPEQAQFITGDERIPERRGRVRKMSFESLKTGEERIQFFEIIFPVGTRK